MPLPRILNKEDIIDRIAFGSDAYRSELDLRYAVLRKPLGLVFTPEQLAPDAECIHIGYSHNARLIACLLLQPGNNKRIKMKQVAVEPSWQQKGIGKMLVEAAEDYARESGYDIIFCHARETAVPFYLKRGYEISGAPFTEVTIPHVYMEKRLR